MCSTLYLKIRSLLIQEVNMLNYFMLFNHHWDSQNSTIVNLSMMRTSIITQRNQKLITYLALMLSLKNLFLNFIKPFIR